MSKVLWDEFILVTTHSQKGRKYVKIAKKMQFFSKKKRFHLTFERMYIIIYTDTGVDSMALNKFLKVEMPKNKIFISSSNARGIPYVYHVFKSYRNSSGQPTCDRISIGRKDFETGMLIPNDNFFDIYECEVVVKVKGLKK